MKLEHQVDDMLAVDVIRHSSSPFSALALLVHKANGTWRFYMDYRGLNQVMVKFHFPGPIIDELLDEHCDATVFSKLDLRSGFHQIKMYEPDVPKIVFRTRDGHFKFLMMPFGLYNAPSTFQASMNSMLKPFSQQFVLVFFNDILVYSPNFQTHFTHLVSVFEVMHSHKLKLKALKCWTTTVAYLGHIISAEGMAVDSQKGQCILVWPQSRTLKGLRGFLGLAGY